MKRVMVAMSGGVDSSVAAALLQEQGYEVIGATMLVWSPPGVDMGYSDSCCGLSAAEDARRVCARLGIRHYTFDLKDAFYEAVVRPYVEDYRLGRTPNPCVRCNQFIKFQALMDRARALGADYLATGHYARIRYDEPRGRWLLLRGADRRKDQSYALYRLSQEQLARTLFPLGEMDKERVRALALELELPTAGKPDSQETCFVPNNDYPALIRLLAPDTFRAGEIRDPEGRVLGRHEGLPAYTLGQRKRIRVGSPVPLYVSRIDRDANAITVAPAGHESLYRREVVTEDAHLIGIPLPDRSDGGDAGVPLPEALAVTAKVRYNAVDQPASLAVEPCDAAPGGYRLRVRFEEPVRAPAPGQSLVCYRGDEVVGGGIIAG